MRRLAALLVLVPGLALGAVTYQGSGATTVTAGTGTCTAATAGVTWQADDILVVYATSEREASAGVAGVPSLSTANSFVAVTNASQTAGAGGSVPTNPEIGAQAWWKRATSGADSMPVVADSGDHTTCALHVFRGAATTGDPWYCTAGGNDGSVNDTSGSIPGCTTGTAGALVALFQGTSNNATSTANCSSWTNANLASLTEWFDSTNTSALGGGHCLSTGTYSGTGDFGATTVTLGATTYKSALSIAFKPVPPPSSTIALDTTACASGGSSCPGGTQNNNSTTTIQTASFSTAGARLIVAETAWDCGSTLSLAMSDTAGLSWSSAVSATDSSGSVISQIFTAVSSSAISSKTITVTRTGGSTCSGFLHVYPLQNATTGGATGTNGNDSSGAVDVTVTVGTTGSWLLCSLMGGGTSQTLAARDDSTLDRTINGGNTSGGAAGRRTDPVYSGSQVCGSSTSDVFRASVGYEVKESSGTTYNDSFTEAVTAASSLAQVATFPNALTEATTAADSLSPAGSTWPNALTESITAGDSLVGGILTSDAVPEAVTAGDSVADAHTMPNASTEAVSAGDSLSTTGTWPNAVTEATSAADSLATTATWPNEVAEGASPDDSLSTTATWPNATTESVSLADSLADELIPGGGNVYNDQITEAVTLTSSLVQVAILAESFTEAIAPAVAPGGPRKRRIGFCEVPGRCD